MTNGSQWTYTATCVLSRAGTHGNAAEGGSETKLDTNVIEHCSDGWSFDATTLDDNGTMLFFKGMTGN